MNKLFINQAWEIYETTKNSITRDSDTGFQMFKSDVTTGTAYNTEREDIDFVALNKEWEAMTVDEQADACLSWREFSMENYKELSKAFTAEDKEAFQEIVNAW